VLAVSLDLVAAHQLFALHDAITCRAEELLFDATATVLMIRWKCGDWDEVAV